jgi:hypothetical protein
MANHKIRGDEFKSFYDSVKFDHFATSEENEAVRKMRRFQITKPSDA